VYEQLAERITELICSGAYAEGERLPPVREVASAHALNPNTVQKTYQLLESKGLIYSVPAKGSYVAGETARAAMKNEALEQFTNSAVFALKHGVDREELKSAFETVLSKTAGQPENQTGKPIKRQAKEDNHD
jgi:GntR family transcriptional regulator